MHTEFESESLQHHFGHLGVDGMIIFKLILQNSRHSCQYSE